MNRNTVRLTARYRPLWLIGTIALGLLVAMLSLFGGFASIVVALDGQPVHATRVRVDSTRRLVDSGSDVECVLARPDGTRIPGRRLAPDPRPTDQDQKTVRYVAADARDRAANAACADDVLASAPCGAGTRPSRRCRRSRSRSRVSASAQSSGVLDSLGRRSSGWSSSGPSCRATATARTPGARPAAARPVPRMCRREDLPVGRRCPRLS